MRGVVYIDMLFFINALIGWFLLCCGAKLAGLATRTWRLFLGGVLAGVSSLILLLPPLPQAVLWLLKLGSAALIVFAAYPAKAPRIFFKGMFWYVFLNLSLSGVVFAAMYYGTTNGIETNNMTLYFNVSPLVLIASVTIVYLLVEVCSYVFGKPQDEALAPFSVNVLQHEITGMALLDTGFHVRDPIGGMPAFLLSFPMVKSQLPPALAMALDTYFLTGTLEAETDGPLLRLIPAKTAAGQRALPALRTQCFTLKTIGRHHAQAPDMMAVFTPEPLGDGSFSAIINLKIYQEYQ